jgi:hypothetical protein
MVWIAGANSAFNSFTNIPQTFSHLQLRVYGRTTTSATSEFAYLRFNGDTSTSNYRSHILYGDGSIASSFDYGTGRNYLLSSYLTAASAPTGAFGCIVIDILDYANTSKNKTMRSIGGFDNNGNGTATLMSGLWMNTSAITALEIGPFTGASVAGSRIDLYGITSSQVTGA